MVRTQATRRFSCSPEAVFDFVVDPARFPRAFVGFGLIPSLRSVTLDGPLMTGGTRQMHSSDGSVLTEHITVLDRPVHHAYTLFGFRSPFSWLVTLGEADWCIRRIETGTEVTWRYVFTTTTPLVYPICALVIGFFMRPAMQRCLDEMARLLASEAKKP